MPFENNSNQPNINLTNKIYEILNQTAKLSFEDQAALFFNSTAIRHAINLGYNPADNGFFMRNLFAKQEIQTTSQIELDISPYVGNTEASISDSYVDPMRFEPPAEYTIAFAPMAVKKNTFLSLKKLATRVQHGSNRYSNNNLFTMASVVKDTTEMLIRSVRTSFERMGANLLFTGKIPIQATSVISQLGGQSIVREYNFWPEQNKPYTKVTNSWDSDKATIFSDISAACSLMQNRANVTPNMMIIGQAVYDAMLQNKAFTDLLDNHRIDLGFMKPQQNEGVLYAGYLNGLGLHIFVYNTTSISAETGKATPIIPENKVLIAYADPKSEFAGCCFATNFDYYEDGLATAKGNIQTQNKPINANVKLNKAPLGWDISAVSYPGFYLAQPQAFQVLEVIFA